MSSKPSTALTILAGSCAGASETVVTYPFEFIKTYRQLPVYKNVSTLTIIRSIYSSVGVSGFYAGCSTLACSNALKSSVRFLSFSSAQNYMRKPFEKAGLGSAAVNITAGLTAGIAESIVVVTPGECLKTRMIQHAARGGSGRNLGMIGAVRDVARSEGILALWRGLTPVLCKQGTNSAVRFACFASLKEQVAKRWPGKEKMVAVTLGIGGVSGIATVYASMPFDNIKTRLQSTGHDYRGMLDCAMRTLREEGVTAFWRGSTPRLARLILSSGITFAVFDKVVSTVQGIQKPDLRAANEL